MDSSRFKGTTVALVTPFKHGGEVDESRLKELVDWQIEQGTDVILPMGTTGEASTLSVPEHHRVIELVVGHVAGRCPVLCGAGNNATRDAITMTQFAESAGADAVLSVGPYYNKPTQEGFYQHFKAIAESTELPIIIYNVPGRTGSNISAETTIRLSSIKNIIGTKEASGDLSQISHVLAGRPEGFLVLSGDDALTLPMMSLGADGAISVVANQTPGRFGEMVRAAAEGDWDKAREIHFQLLALMEANFVESNPIPVKAGLALMGKLEENYRLPLVKISDKNREKLRVILGELGLV
jgi:4-hydroxy-tetrahydrodipicolinate synthase